MSKIIQGNNNKLRRRELYPSRVLGVQQLIQATRLVEPLYLSKERTVLRG